MKKIIPITLTILFACFATTALADSGYSRSSYERGSYKGDRIDRQLDTRGDRIERKFDRKADRAAERGNYRQAYHFQKKGDRINRHLDRKGHRIHNRFEHRDRFHNGHHHHPGYPRVKYQLHGQWHDNTHFSMMIQQPGLWVGWNISN